MGGRADEQPLRVGFAAGVRGWDGVGSFARWTFQEGWSSPRAGKSNFEAGRAAWQLGLNQSSRDPGWPVACTLRGSYTESSRWAGLALLSANRTVGIRRSVRPVPVRPAPVSLLLMSQNSSEHPVPRNSEQLLDSKPGG